MSKKYLPLQYLPGARLLSCAVAACAMLGAFSAAAQTHPASTASGSGFLADYSVLVKSGNLRRPYLAFRATDAKPVAGQKLYLAPLARYPQEAKFAAVEDPVAKQALDFAEASLRKELAGKFELVSTPETATVQLQAVVSDIGKREEGASAADLIPLRLIANSVRTAAKGRAMEAMVKFELRLVDAQSQKLLYEAVHVNAGKGVGRANDSQTPIPLEALKPAVDDWAKSVAEALVAVPSGASTAIQ